MKRRLEIVAVLEDSFGSVPISTHYADMTG